jgi:hypothetical protein
VDWGRGGGCAKKAARPPPLAAPPHATGHWARPAAWVRAGSGYYSRKKGMYELKGMRSDRRPQDQLRDQRGQRRRYWPPFAPWVQ